MSEHEEKVLGSSQDAVGASQDGAVAPAVGHTPSPWSVVRYGDGDSLAIHEGEDWRVCFMATPGESPGAMDRIEAYARLIAAAPELLEACREFERIATLVGNYEEFRGSVLTNGWGPKLAKIRAAIAKATPSTLSGGAV